MKKYLPTLAIVLICNILISQTKEISYMTGSLRVPGYKTITKTLNISTYTFTASSVRAPILQVYVCDKRKFIGGILENNKGEKTTIVNMTLVETANDAKFEVVGKDFSRSFTLYEGEMLQEKSNFTIFYTEKVGIWKIYKKTVTK